MLVLQSGERSDKVLAFIWFIRSVAGGSILKAVWPWDWGMGTVTVMSLASTHGIGSERRTVVARQALDNI